MNGPEFREQWLCGITGYVMGREAVRVSQDVVINGKTVLQAGRSCAKDTLEAICKDNNVIPPATTRDPNVRQAAIHEWLNYRDISDYLISPWPPIQQSEVQVDGRIFNVGGGMKTAVSIEIPQDRRISVTPFNLIFIIDGSTTMKMTVPGTAPQGTPDANMTRMGMVGRALRNLIPRASALKGCSFAFVFAGSQEPPIQRGFEDFAPFVARVSRVEEGMLQPRTDRERWNCALHLERAIDDVTRLRAARRGLVENTTIIYIGSALVTNQHEDPLAHLNGDKCVVDYLRGDRSFAFHALHIGGPDEAPNVLHFLEPLVGPDGVLFSTSCYERPFEALCGMLLSIFNRLAHLSFQGVEISVLELNPFTKAIQSYLPNPVQSRTSELPRRFCLYNDVPLRCVFQGRRRTQPRMFVPPLQRSFPPTAVPFDFPAVVAEADKAFFDELLQDDLIIKLKVSRDREPGARMDELRKGLRELAEWLDGGRYGTLTAFATQTREWIVRMLRDVLAVSAETSLETLRMRSILSFFLARIPHAADFSAKLEGIPFSQEQLFYAVLFNVRI